MGSQEMEEIADCIAELLEDLDSEANIDRVRERTLHLCQRFPIPYGLN
jgi:glycine/serine hydroxymethyltransferase